MTTGTARRRAVRARARPRVYQPRKLRKPGSPARKLHTTRKGER